MKQEFKAVLHSLEAYETEITLYISINVTGKI
jgi:hypothetical protein